ncbi:MAG: RdgB/HAM1 family non-canonical purine NTP pyrophosphatase [Bacteroidetes bacterium]|nr:RdgB/HAM1 family non-canonical purine NTP pyrophosphatase [Bacteroidota bacterium]
MKHVVQPLQTIVLATRNPGKVAELAAMLEELPVQLISAADVHNAPHVEEDADSLRGNAEKKARELFEHTGLPSLADDTGLEVDALAGAPGIHSARYAGSKSDDKANRAKLLAALEGREDRSARFRTSLAFVDIAGTHFFDGVCEGVITNEERGGAGFGYDAVFQPDDAAGSTFAEMDKAQKNLISHRGRALAQFVRFLEEQPEH